MFKWKWTIPGTNYLYSGQHGSFGYSPASIKNKSKPKKPVSRSWKALLILHIFLHAQKMHSSACFDLSRLLASCVPDAIWMPRTRAPLSSFVEINWVRAKAWWSWLWNLLLGNIKWCFNQLKAPLEFLGAENGCSCSPGLFMPTAWGKGWGT